MRRRKTGYILLALLVITGLAGTYHSSLSARERKTAISYLKETRNLFLNSVKGLNKAQLNFKTDPKKLSIRQCIEHISITEKKLSEIAAQNLQQPSDPAKRNEIVIKDEEIIQLITDPSQRTIAEEFSQLSSPAYKKTSGYIDAFKSVREKNIYFVKTTTEDLRNHFLQHPVLGTVDNYQYLLMLAALTKRYTLQIEQIKSSPDFPNN